MLNRFLRQRRLTATPGVTRLKQFALGLCIFVPMLGYAAQLSEIRIDQPSSDNDEYFELSGTANESLDGLSLIVIGDGSTASGTIESVTDLSGQSLDSTGFFVAAESTFTIGVADLTTTLNFENSDNVTFLLVEGFTGSNGDDLDTDDDGNLDSSPWTAISDCVALIESFTSGEQTYCSTSVGPDGSFVPAHPILCPGGWQIGQFDTLAGDDTPGMANQCAGAVEPVLVINEIDYDQAGSDTAEFIEIANTGTVAADLSEFSLDLINGSTGASYNTIALSGGSLNPGEYYVVCADAANTANCDQDVSPNSNLIQNGAPDAVALLRNGNLVDSVSYEGDVAAPYTEGSGVGLIDVSSLDMGSISRFPDGSDTDQNNVDFSLRCHSPGETNSAQTENCGVVQQAELVINEIDYDQPGTDFAEFVEIKNIGAGSVNLAGFALELVNGNGGSPYNTINLPNVQLAAGDYFVVCGDASIVFNCDLDVSPDSNLIQNGAPDAVALTQGGNIIDTVSYEGDVSAPYTEGSGAGLFDSSSGGIGGANENKGISRIPDGNDTDMNNADFAVRCVSPGEANSADTDNCPLPGPTLLVVNEIDYDQPGSDTAEFIEIKNAGTSDVDLGSIELTLINGNGGSAYQTIALPAVTLSAEDYFVVCANAATVANCDLEALNSIQNGAPDAVALIEAGAILDTVSYEGDVTAPYTEGSGAGLADSGSSGQDFKGIARFPDGSDTDQNNIDLINTCITPGAPNTAIDTECSATGPVLEIFTIQGSGAASAFAGQTLNSNDNIVTAVGPEGFFMQTPTDRSDADINTSDGIYVFTGGAPGVAVGDQVDVNGTIVEFFEFTEVSNPIVNIDSSGNPLPPAVVFDAAVPSPDPLAPSCVIEYECYEGMLIEIPQGTVGGANQRFNSDISAEIYVTASGDRAFREPGIEFPGLLGLPEWDGNPEVFEVDVDKLGLPNQIVNAGSSFSAIGALGFEFGDYELWPTSFNLTQAPLPVAVRDRAAGEFTVGSLNLFRLFDDVADSNETVVSAAEYMARLSKFSSYIRDVLKAPDILAVQEAEKLGVLQDLANLINADDPTISYTAYLVEGNDVGGIDVGFLVRDSISVDAVTQLGANEILDFDGSLLHDRPPLLLEGRCTANGSNFPVQVMAIHNRSLSGIDSTSSGPRVRAKRLAQAQSIAEKVQAIQDANADANLVVTGDFNAFQFSDGYVDVTGQMAGDFDPAQNLLSGPDLVNPDLINQVSMLPSEEQYSFVFRGNAQALDQTLTSQNLDSLVRDFAFGRGNADAAVDYINDASTALRSSDHDGMVLFIIKDSDGDSITDDIDACPNTMIPEDVPSVRLGTNRFALVDDDTVFDTTPPNGTGPQVSFTLQDTGGCSCSQIIDQLGLGKGHEKFGCSIEAMQTWVDQIAQP